MYIFTVLFIILLFLYPPLLGRWWSVNEDRPRRTRKYARVPEARFERNTHNSHGLDDKRFTAAHLDLSLLSKEVRKRQGGLSSPPALHTRHLYISLVGWCVHKDRDISLTKQPASPHRLDGIACSISQKCILHCHSRYFYPQRPFLPSLLFPSLPCLQWLIFNTHAGRKAVSLSGVCKQEHNTSRNNLHTRWQEWKNNIQQSITVEDREGGNNLCGVVPMMTPHVSDWISLIFPSKET